ncbi:hypothetical protein RHMOL_Rhmol04G0056600 [Rhododendron molle]|uniref:Uncharacterized protein n=1 Tax=Rhododendron molle TaxID=49168 RepID=A0ACC0NZS7_RHOML|nr:hypothetical protein RHMOL_Rhmol04G0056600 [Rhododendron molle]
MNIRTVFAAYNFAPLRSAALMPMECLCGKDTVWKKISSLLVILSLLSSCFTDFRSVDAQLLPPEEGRKLVELHVK